MHIRSLRLFFIVILSLILWSCADRTKMDAQKFINNYSVEYKKLYTEASEAQWISNTDISDLHTQQEVEVNKRFAAFKGRKEIIDSV